MRRGVTVLVVALVLGLAIPAQANDLAAAISGLRGSSLTLDGKLSNMAQGAAQRMAGSGKLSHSDLGPLLGHCLAAGEVIGYGSDVASVVNAFANSSSHRSIIKNSKWTAMGTGQVRDGAGTLWVSVVFCVLASSPTPATTTTVSATAATATQPAATNTQPAAPAQKATPAPAPSRPKGPVVLWNTGPILNSEGTISVMLGASPFISEDEWRLFPVPTIS
jgi:hypothetical protein